MANTEVIVSVGNLIDHRSWSSDPQVIVVDDRRARLAWMRLCRAMVRQRWLRRALNRAGLFWIDAARDAYPA